jgi:hypothetical protein
MDDQPNIGTESGLPASAEATIYGSGDLSSLTPPERSEYYAAVCRSLGLNPLTKPFEYLTLNGKLRLYALRDCADQLRRIHGISIYISKREQIGDIYVITARAKDRFGREDESTGAVPLLNLKGDALANAYMKCETKAKRRVTLSIAGLGWLDETEIDVSRPRPSVDRADGEVPVTPVQVNSLVELAKSTGVDLTSFGHDMRRLMNLSAETKITKKFLRETMTAAQYDEAWAHYTTVLQRQVETDSLDTPSADEDVPLHEPPDGDTPETSGVESTPAPSTAEPPAALATPEQIATLRELAQQVGEDAYADVQDVIEHHPGGLDLTTYLIMGERLQARLAKVST